MNEILYTFVPIAVTLVFSVVVIGMVYSLFSNFRKTSNILQNGEWKSGKIIEKEKISYNSDPDPYKYGYHFKVQLEDGTILEHNTLTHDSYTNKLMKEQEIRVLVYEGKFMFKNDVKIQLKAKNFRKYAEKHKTELEKGN